MSPPDIPSATHALELRLGNLLRIGVTLAACVVLLGGALYLVRHAQDAPAYHTFHGEPAGLRTVTGILSESGRLSGRGIIQLGLLLLIGTPIARVAFAAYGFARQKDWLYVGISTLVLSLLLFGLLSVA